MASSRLGFTASLLAFSFLSSSLFPPRLYFVFLLLPFLSFLPIFSFLFFFFHPLCFLPTSCSHPPLPSPSSLHIFSFFFPFLCLLPPPLFPPLLSLPIYLFLFSPSVLFLFPLLHSSPRPFLCFSSTHPVPCVILFLPSPFSSSFLSHSFPSPLTPPSRIPLPFFPLNILLSFLPPSFSFLTLLPLLPTPHTLPFLPPSLPLLCHCLVNHP